MIWSKKNISRYCPFKEDRTNTTSAIYCTSVLLSLEERESEEQDRIFYFTRTDKKENKIFLIYKEIQSGAVAKSYMRKGFLIYEEMRKYFPIHEEALVIYDFATAPF
jgi:hypothetical protein